MEKEFVDIILEKQFIELTPSEKENLSEWFVNEDEFEQLKHVFTEVENMKVEQTYTPKAETKKSLDELFTKQHPKITPVFWYNSVLMVLYPTDKPLFRRPLIQFAALGLIFLLATPLLFKEKMIASTNQIAQVEDTKIIEKDANETKDIIDSKTETGDNTLLSENNLPSDRRQMNTGGIEVDSRIISFSEPTVSFEFTSSLDTWDHSDGIFDGVSSIAYSECVSAEPAVFDLLTAAF